MSLHALGVGVLPDIGNDGTERRIFRDKISRENTLIAHWVCQERNGQSVLFGVKPVAHELRVILGHVDVVDMHNHPGF